MSGTQSSGGDRLLRSAGIISAAVALSRVTGMVREMTMAHLFGASAAYDAFLLGFRIPNLTRDLFAEGALSSAFVPVFTAHLAREGKESAARLFRIVATVLAVIVGLLVIAGMVFAPVLVRLMAPGFAQVPGKFDLAVMLARVMFPFLLLVALAALSMGALNACHRFGVPALSSTAFNLGSVGFGVAFAFTCASRFGVSPIAAMGYGVVFGGALQLLTQIPLLLREGFSFRPLVDLRHPGLHRILRLMGPAIVGNAAVQVNVMVNTNFASSLLDASGHVMDGPVSWLGYAFRFMQLPLGIFGVAIASATLPDISRSAALGRIEEFRATLGRSLSMVLLLTIPSSVGLVVLCRGMIAAVYQSGNFHAAETEQVARALACYAVGLTGYAATKILAPAFYALNDATSPMLVSLASIAVNYLVASTMVGRGGFGHAGLALSTASVALFGAAVLFVVLNRRIGAVGGRTLAVSAMKMLLASAVMGVVCRASSGAVHSWLGFGRGAGLADVAVSVPLGGAVFYAVARLLRTAGLEQAEAAVSSFWARRTGVR